MSESTAVTRREEKGITGLLKSEEARLRIAPLLRGVEYDRVVGEAYIAASDNPEILQCTPASIIRAVARACSWGLAIGEQAYLVPFNVKVSKKGEEDRWEKRLQAIQGYQGKIELIVRAGGAKSIRAEVVYAKEQFEYTEGTNPVVVHKRARTAGERGALVGAYAIADHGYSRPAHVKYMTVDEVDAIRQKYSKQWKLGTVPPWYMLKTCVHQLAKLLPKSPRMAPVLETLEDDEREDEVETLTSAPVATVAAPAAAALPSGEETNLDDRWIEEQENRASGDHEQNDELPLGDRRARTRVTD